jgi:hypothetical protein
MAVEMCKLSLWLVSMDKTKPFSFVDDKIFCGNSLLGVTSLDQLRYLHIYPESRSVHAQLLVDIDVKIAEATRLRRELASPVEEHDPMRSSRGKLALLEELRKATADLRVIADGIIATGLSLGGRPGGKLDDAYKVLSWELSQAYPRDDSKGDFTKVENRIDAGLTPTVQTDYERWRPLHWVLEVPDVMVERGGFDAVVGNPPFLADKRMKSSLGDGVREYLSQHIASNVRGGADLAAYFLLRAGRLVKRQDSTLGLIATNTVAQGDSREVGLEQLVRRGLVIVRAWSSRPWPSRSAQLEFIAVWGSFFQRDSAGSCTLDDTQVAGISTLLEPEGRVKGRPYKLATNARIAFVGALLQGEGFILSNEERSELLQQSPSESKVILPYLNGAELNTSPETRGTRWAINFGNRTQTEAQVFPRAYERVERLVKPERVKVNRKSNRERWWLYAEYRPGLFAAIEGLDSVLAISRVTAHPVFVRVPSPQIFSDRLVVITDPSYERLAALSSKIHVVWLEKWGATLETRTMYPASDVFETFPFPTSWRGLAFVGRELEETRREIMLRRELGLTALYNLVNDRGVQGDHDVDRMRQIHVEVDEATMAAYDWHDLPLGHGFHTHRQMERWTVSPAARVEILDRLLELNHERARAEGQDVPEQGELL